MAFEVPIDLINEVQILLRKQAKLSFYGPNDPSLTNLPLLEESISGFDPSPTYLRCKLCNGKLLQGINSLICVYCGAPQKIDLPPEPISFKSTTGYKWLLQSLDLDGSESVAPSTDSNESNRGQTAQKEEILLSELLDLEIKWTEQSEKIEPSVSLGAPTQSKSLLNMAGVDLGNFFTDPKEESALNLPDKQSIPGNTNKTTEGSAFSGEENLSLSENVQPSKTVVAEPIAFSGQENLSLFENVQPSKPVVVESIAFPSQENHGMFENVQPTERVPKSTEQENDDSFSGWEVEFQSAGPGEHEDFKFSQSVSDSAVDLSMHMDTLFGTGKDSKDIQQRDDSAQSSSMANDWMQDDLWNNSKPVITNELNQIETTIEGNNTGKLDTSYDASSSSADWFHDDLRSSAKSLVYDQARQSEATLKMKDVETMDEFNHSFTTSDWFQGDQWQTSSTKEPSTTSDWFQDDQRQTTSAKAPPTTSDWFQDDLKQTNSAKTPSTISDWFQEDQKQIPSAKTPPTTSDWFQEDQRQTANTKAPPTTSDWFQDDLKQTSGTKAPSTTSDWFQDNQRQPSSAKALSATSDWFQDDQRQTSSAKAPSTTSAWFQDAQWQKSSTKTPESKQLSEDDDSFDDWNDFASSSQDLIKQSAGETVTLGAQFSDMNLIGSADNFQDMDFGSFLQADLFPGAFSNKNGSLERNNKQPGRVADPKANTGGHKQEDDPNAANQSKIKQGDDPDAAYHSNVDDVEKFMSQMHDLSFMLESNLSIRSKQDGNSMSQE
ncbi:hypothetical protein RJ641_017260 [Dillenia turbinata]|uniref:DUF7815 domain-containing protein n=1 Tax=Dillenia turbinata TaxID=194707 RepID=A0AAN8UZX7_9MAGN